jgi:hypothetical protein
MKNKEIEELLNYIDQFVYVDQTYNDIKLSKIDCKLLLSYIEQLENNRDKAIEYIEKAILDNRINEVNWDYDECYFSDMPAERIKPLIDILKGDSE